MTSETLLQFRWAIAIATEQALREVIAKAARELLG
jgi:hypothetical protein